jgi:hypothetical protein
MLDYQKLQIVDMSGGITDSYKSVGKGKWKILKNVITTDNLSLKTRNGVSVYTAMGAAGIYAIKQIGEYTYVVGSNYIKVIQNGVVASTATHPTVTAPAVFTLNFGGKPVSIQRYKNSVLINGNNDTSDKELLLATITSASTTMVRKASLPAITSITSAVGDRLLACVVVRKYTDVDGFTFLDYGPEKIVAWDGTSAMTATFPSLEEYRGASDSTSVYFFATEPNGTTFSLGQSIAVTTTGTTAACVAATVVAALPTGEVFAFEQEAIKRQAPVCDYFTMAGGIGWYASINDTIGKRGSRAIHSVDGIPSSVIQSAYTDFDSPINGVGSLNSLPIFLTDDSVYRVDGNIGIDNSGFLRKVRIPNSEGGISHGSIVVANESLYYCGTDGIYVTDGYSAKNITGPDFYKTYISYINVRSEWQKITSTFDRDTNIIYWRMNHNTLFALELNTGSISVLEYPESYNIISLESAYLPLSALVGYTNKIVSNINVPPVVHPAVPNFRYVAYEVDTARYFLLGEQYKIIEPLGSTVTGIVDRIIYKPEEILAGEYPLTGNFNENTIIVKYVGTETPDVTAGDFYAKCHESFGYSNRKLLLGTLDSHLLSSSENEYSDTELAGNADNSYIDEEAQMSSVRKHIDIDILTSGLSYGDSATRKWVREVTLAIRTEFKSSVEPYVIVEDNESQEIMKYISSESLGAAFGNDEMVGSGVAMFQPRQIISGKRHLPKGFCRCRHNQIGIRSTITPLYSSTDFGKLLITATTADTQSGTLAKYDDDPDLMTDIGVLFPYDLVGKSIKVFDADGKRSTSLAITAVSTDRTSITFALPTDVSLQEYSVAGATYDWNIYGYRRDQRIELMSIDIAFSLLSNSANGNNPSLNVGGKSGQ